MSLVTDINAEVKPEHTHSYLELFRVRVVRVHYSM